VTTSLLLVVLSAFGADAPVAEAADTVIVCPPQFHEALRPWMQYRADQGHRFAIASHAKSAKQIRAEIRAIARSGDLKYVLLVGDAEPTAETDATVRKRCVPTFHLDAKVNVKWGSEPILASDNPYADLDDDGEPDLAVGRLPVDNVQELSALVRRLIAYEKSQDLDLWRRNIHFVAGVGGFGVIADTVLERVTGKFIADGIPAAYSTTVTYGSWRSPYCPDPRDFHQVTVDRLNEGGLFWVYIGHGHSRMLDRVRVPGGSHHILDVRDMAKLKVKTGPPIALFLACYTGAFDFSHDCLAEDLIRTEGGPIAAISGSRVTMPYAMAVMGDGMLHEYFEKKRPTLGMVLLHAKQRMLDTETDQPNRRMIDSIATVLSPSRNELHLERAEHAALFNLFGDPLLRLKHGKEISLTAEKKATAGEKIIVRCDSPVKGDCTVELVCRRDRLRFTPPTRDRYLEEDKELADYNRVYEAANNTRWAAGKFPIEKGEFEQEIKIPHEAAGACHVRVFIAGQNDFALGATDVYIRRPPASDSQPQG